MMLNNYAAMLPKMGFNQHLPKTIRYGPKKYNGKGLTHLSIHQHAKHLEIFVSHLRYQTHLGKILRMQMDKMQLFLGTEEHFLTLSSDDFKYTEPNRMHFL